MNCCLPLVTNEPVFAEYYDKEVFNCYAHRSGVDKYMAIFQRRKAVHTNEDKQQAAPPAFSAFPELKYVILLDEGVDILEQITCSEL